MVLTDCKGKLFSADSQMFLLLFSFRFSRLVVFSSPVSKVFIAGEWKYAEKIITFVSMYMSEHIIRTYL